MNHCKTCRHFKAVYPENAQLGNCEYLRVTDNQPCGHTISGRFISTEVFKSTDVMTLPICVNRVMGGGLLSCPAAGGASVLASRTLRIVRAAARRESRPTKVAHYRVMDDFGCVYHFE